MTVLVKGGGKTNEVKEADQTAFLAPNEFRVQTNRLTNREETYLKIKGAFKVKVQNKGDVEIKIFGNYPLPSHSEETFETGDSNLKFGTDTAIEFEAPSLTENINILLTCYFK